MALATSTLAMIGLGLNVISAVSQAKAQEKQANYQAAVYEQQAERDRQVAAQEERDFRKKQSALMAQKRAEMGGAGIKQTTGTPLISSEDFMDETELQAMRIREGGEVGATRLEQQASLTRTAGKNAKTQGYMRAGASLLTGIGEIDFGK